MKKRYLLISIISLSTAGIVLSILSFLNIRSANELVEEEFIVVESSAEFENITYPIQVDGSIPYALVAHNNNWINIFNPQFILIFNGYPSEIPYQRMFVFSLSKNSILDFSYNIDKRRGGLIEGGTFEDIRDYVSSFKPTVEQFNNDKYSITLYDPIENSEILGELNRNNDSQSNLSESERELEEYNNFFDTLSNEEQLKELIRLYSELTPESEYWSYKVDYESEISLRLEEDPY